MADFLGSSLFDPNCAPRERLNFGDKRKKKTIQQGSSTSPKNGESSDLFYILLNNLFTYIHSRLYSYKNLEDQRDLLSEDFLREDSATDLVQTSQRSDSLRAPLAQPEEDLYNDDHQRLSGSHRPYKGVQKGKRRRKKRRLRVKFFFRLLLNLRHKLTPSVLPEEELLFVERRIKKNKKKKSMKTFVKKKRKTASVLYGQSKRTLKTRKKKMKKSVEKGCRNLGYGLSNMKTTLPDCPYTTRTVRFFSYEHDYVYNPDNRFY